MDLYYTPRSHFSRKVRVLADAWQVEPTFVDVGDVSENSDEFAGNPLMRVPALVDGDEWLIDSDHIASYLCRRFDPQDRFGVLKSDVPTLNARAVMNGIMASEVELILAQRGGVATTSPRFDKMRASIRGGLAWLEARQNVLFQGADYTGFHLVCLWDHLALYGLVPLEYPGLLDVVGSLSKLSYVAMSAPT